MNTRKALIVIDVQNALFESPVGLHNENSFISNVASLIAKAREADIPVVYTQQCGSTDGSLERDTWGWQIHPGLGRRNHEKVVTKTEADAFQDSGLEGLLRDLGAADLYFCGFSAPDRMDATVRSAHDRGYRVTVVADARTTLATAELPSVSRFGREQTTDAVSF